MAVHGAPSSCSRRISFRATIVSVNLSCRNIGISGCRKKHISHGNKNHNDNDYDDKNDCDDDDKKMLMIKIMMMLMMIMMKGMMMILRENDQNSALSR